MINPAIVLQIKQAWETFTANHPKIPLFMKAAAQGGIREDSIIEIAITTPEGRKMETNLIVKADDMALFNSIKEMLGQSQ